MPHSVYPGHIYNIKLIAVTKQNKFLTKRLTVDVCIVHLDPCTKYSCNVARANSLI